MGFDEFSEKLRELKEEFRRTEGRDVSTVAELELFMARRKVRPTKKSLKSLKGLSL